MECVTSRSYLLRGMRRFLLAVLFFTLFFFGSPLSARAETNIIIPDFEISLSYGQSIPATGLKYETNDKKKFKIVDFLADGEIEPLVADGHVVAAPRADAYALNASTNAVPCADDWTPLTDGSACYGTIRVTIREKNLPIVFTADALVKPYGVAPDTLSWDFAKNSDRDERMTLEFSSAGLAADAPIGIYDDLTVAAVKIDGVDRSAYYHVTKSVVGSEDPVRLTVNPAPLTVVYDKELSLPCNHYLSEDGESVTTVETAGANGESLISYYRIKGEHPRLLTVDESYEIECFRSVLRLSNGEISADLSDYEIDYSYVTNTITATKGSLTICQDQAILDAHPYDDSYLFYPISFFYLDTEVRNAGGRIEFEEIPYHETSIRLVCFISDAPISGAIPCGIYALSKDTFGCEYLSDVALSDVSLTVTRRRLAYVQEDSAEYGTTDFRKETAIAFDGTNYAFTLIADLAGATVGDVRNYDSFTSEDPNFDLDFAEAKLTIVKRRTGVSLQGSRRQTVTYGTAYTPAVAYLNHGTAEEQILEDATVLYAYREGTQVRDGLPENAGSYSLTCTLSSPLYETNVLSVTLTIAKKGVAALYYIRSAQKTYGATVDFDASPARLFALYGYDEKIGVEDREQEIEIEIANFGGKNLSSEGGAAEAAVGEYPFDYSTITSQNYEIKKVIAYDVSSKKETTKFTVVKAPKPAAPTFTVTTNANALNVSAKGTIKAELSEKESMSGARSATGEGAVSFAKLNYGQVYYLRVRLEDYENYVDAGEWSAAGRQVIPFPAPEAEVSLLRSESATFTVTVKNAAEGYVIQHRVASGEWKEGTEVTGLKATTTYSLSFRVKNDHVTGDAVTVKIRTLSSPVAEDKVLPAFDRKSGELTVSSEMENLEYMLLDESGEPLFEGWVTAENLPKLQLDSKYVLQVRIAATGTTPASDYREIEIDTHEVKEPFTLKGFLSKWFLVIIGGVLLIVGVVVTILFIRAKKKTDKEEIGGKEK